MALVTLACGTAQAATVSGDGYGSVSFSGGQASDVHIHLGPGMDRVVVTDSAEALEARPGCTRVDEHTAECAVRADPAGVTALVELGGGDDKAVVDPPVWGRVHGGGGNDRIHACAAQGGDGDDTIVGCDGMPNFGHDLEGNNGDDVISGGDGNENIEGGTGRDVVAGGPGNDLLRSGQYYQEPAADEFDGGDGDNIIWSSAGNDFVDAGGGNDVLVDRDGADALGGGPGDDRVVSGDRYRDSIDCGDGVDQVAGDRTDITVACEGIARSALDLIPARLHAADGQVPVFALCSRTETIILGAAAPALWSCAMRITLWVKTHGGLVKAGRGTCLMPKACDPVIALNARGRRLLARHSMRGVVDVVRLPAKNAIPVRERVFVVRGN